MTKLLLVSPLGILFAWSGAWTCTQYSSGGGTIPFNQNPTPTGGSGSQGPRDAGITVVFDPDGGGQSGLQPGADGGVTIGQAANFTSDFAYMSNSADGTISRIAIPAAGVQGCGPTSVAGQPCEQARYYCIVPVDNHGLEPLKGAADIWQLAGSDQLNAGNGGQNSPSRTLVDRNGNVWIALRAPGLQAGATKIVDVGDNLAACTPRCNKRNLLVAGQSFTEGVPLTLSAGGTVTLIPPGLIAPGSAYSTKYYCTDVGADTTGTAERDPRNYDDCIQYSIPLGDPNPDPNADPGKTTKNSSFGRAAAISPNCDPFTSDCDVWIGMWNGATWVRLGEAAPTGGKPFDVADVVFTGVSPYGASVDCAGIIWGIGVNTSGQIALSATTTIALNDPDAGVAVAPDQPMTIWDKGGSFQFGVPNTSKCAYYGISSDPKERVWIAGGSNGAYACSFDATQLLANYTNIVGLPGTWATLQANMLGAWKSYDFKGSGAGYNGAYARGVNVDKANNVYLGIDLGPWNGGGGNGAAGMSFNPDATVGTAANCTLNSSAVACPTAGVVNWAFSDGAAKSHGNGTVGVDLDANGNPWYGSYGSQGSTAGPEGVALQLNAATGAVMNTVAVGNGVYSYSDFTGYALRNITLATGAFSQAFAGCGDSPEFTQWENLGYSADTPPGTDMSIQVVVSNSLDPAVIATLTPVSICNSVQYGACGNPINLKPFNLPGGQYLLVEIALIPKICAANGGATALAKPTLYGVTIGEYCPGN